jgi:hypothetical protein
MPYERTVIVRQRNEAIPAAIAHLKAHWEAIIESWKS